MAQKINRSQIGENSVVLSERISGVRSITLGLWIDRGSRDETLRSAGISHFYEHMVFKATKNRTAQDIAMSLEKNGGSLNAFTGKEQICFHAKFIDTELELASDVLNDLFLNAVFKKEDFTKERGVILEEIKASNDNPEESVHDLLLESLWPDHSLGFPIAGTRSSVKKITLNALNSAKKKMHSSRIVISAAGNVDHKKLVKLFSEVSECGEKKKKVLFADKSKRVLSRVASKDIQQANIAIGFKTCSFSYKDKFPLLVLNAILGDGMSSRLFQNIREKQGLAYSIYSFMEAFHDTGYLCVYAGTEVNSALKTVDSILSEIKNIISGGLKKEELGFIKSYIKGGVLLGMENTSNRMTHLGRSEIYLGKNESIESIIKKIDSVTLADICKVGKKYFSNENLSVNIVAPKGKISKRDILNVGFNFN